MYHTNFRNPVWQHVAETAGCVPILLVHPLMQIRFMVSRPMVVDDSTNGSMDDDDLELVEGAATAAQATGGGADAGKGDSAPPLEKKKSVRLAADGGCTCGSASTDPFLKLRPAMSRLLAVAPSINCTYSWQVHCNS